MHSYEKARYVYSYSTRHWLFICFCNTPGCTGNVLRSVLSPGRAFADESERIYISKFKIPTKPPQNPSPQKINCKKFRMLFWIKPKFDSSAIQSSRYANQLIHRIKFIFIALIWVDMIPLIFHLNINLRLMKPKRGGVGISKLQQLWRQRYKY